ncbi:hypothetical protein RJT34_05922 [Clitoria ternatea]|uniref:Uncharacterized protein n=1 Tax=Clitoria ternatea TaxID=43366 RepID=A0AAN9PTD9_CLITE
MNGVLDKDSLSDSTFEFDESDLYNFALNNSPEFCKSVRASRFHNNSSSSGGRVGTPASLPVNIPDWSKILSDEFKDCQGRNHDQDDDAQSDDKGGGRVPHHEYLAKTRIASFSTLQNL